MKNNDKAEKVFKPQRQPNVPRHNTLGPTKVSYSDEAKRLNTLTEQFDSLLERMQSPKVRRGLAAGFRANTKQLGKAAVAAARKSSMASPSNAAEKNYFQIDQL